jgi:hypothetical protein
MKLITAAFAVALIATPAIAQDAIKHSDWPPSAIQDYEMRNGCEPAHISAGFNSAFCACLVFLAIDRVPCANMVAARDAAKDDWDIIYGFKPYPQWWPSSQAKQATAQLSQLYQQCRTANPY